MTNTTPRILIIDDDPVSQTLMQFMLTSLNCDVFVERDGCDILRKLSTYEPDVLLLDVLMPHYNGYEITRTVKADPLWQHMPIILITSLDQQTDLIEGLNSGADEFLSKPINMAELQARVRSMLRMKERADQLIQLSRLRQDLANMVVHDMRNPLALSMLYTTSLLGKLEKLKQANPGLWQVLEAELDPNKSLEIVQEGLDTLSRLIDDILLLAKTEHEQLVLQLREEDLLAVVRSTAAGFTEVARRQKVNLALDLPSVPWKAAFDRNLIVRLVGNLLDNAIKYSPQNGTILLRASPTRDGLSCILEVIDEGPGIPPAQREMIFDRYKVAAVPNGIMRGIGLGLAFCRMAITSHGGSIYVRNNQPRGSVFVVTLPKRPLTQQPKSRSKKPNFQPQSGRQPTA